MIQEKEGSRKFERLSRWNLLNYTIISQKSEFAKYTDNYDINNNKLFLTYFNVAPKKYPYRRFKDLDTSIVLTDGTILTKQDTETGYYLEVDKKKERVRMYEEVINET